MVTLERTNLSVRLRINSWVSLLPAPVVRIHCSVGWTAYGATVGSKTFQDQLHPSNLRHRSVHRWNPKKVAIEARNPWTRSIWQYLSRLPSRGLCDQKTGILKLANRDTTNVAERTFCVVRIFCQLSSKQICEIIPQCSENRSFIRMTFLFNLIWAWLS